MPCGVENHLSDAKGGRKERVLLRARYERYARRLRHLHHRNAAGKQSVTRSHGLSGGAGNDDIAELASHAADKRLHRALAAIGKRTHHALCTRNRAANPIRCGVARLKRRKTTLERINRYYNFHPASLQMNNASSRLHLAPSTRSTTFVPPSTGKRHLPFPGKP